jgi:hypothetical protein
MTGAQNCATSSVSSLRTQGPIPTNDNRWVTLERRVPRTISAAEYGSRVAPGVRPATTEQGSARLGSLICIDLGPIIGRSCKPIQERPSDPPGVDWNYRAFSNIWGNRGMWPHAPLQNPPRPFKRGALMERWPSGLRRTLGKRVCGKPYRGFESHSLRHHTVFAQAASADLFVYFRMTEIIARAAFCAGCLQGSGISRSERLRRASATSFRTLLTKLQSSGVREVRMI